jgi:hypothetical protein
MRSLIALSVLLAGFNFGQTPMFYPDDPLLKMPSPEPATKLKFRKLSDIYDVFYNDFGEPGEHWKRGDKSIAAQGTDTLGEVPDGPWYVKRHYFSPMSTVELVKGAAITGPPSKGKWTVVAAKNEGVTPGFTVIDENKRRYVIKFDPQQFPEIATAPDVLVSRFFYALGYHVPENYIVHFDREQLEIGEDTQILDAKGLKRKMTAQDLGTILLGAQKHSDGRYRASASLFLSGKPVGPHRYHGTRRDDPNDLVPHEHRRDLRGLRIFCAWLGHDDSRAVNSLDMLVETNGIPHVQHYLIDFGSALGSASNGPNSPRSGNVPFFNFKEASAQFLTLGLYTPAWMRAKYPNLKGAGRFESDKFRPDGWTPEYFNPAFSNMTDDDAFWAAKQVAAFTDDQIAAIVKTGEFTEPKTVDWITKCLIERRNKIANRYLRGPLAIDKFAVERQQLKFTNLVAGTNSSSLDISWAEFDNVTRKTQSLSSVGADLPGSSAEYLVATISSKIAPDPKGLAFPQQIRVYVRKSGSEARVVGIERQ